MIYLHRFKLPTLAQEEDHAGRYWGVVGNPHPNEYPYGIFPYKRLTNVGFSEITIFYGGNGSGKSTLLNLIAESLKLPRITPFNRSTYFDEYVSRMCSHEATGGVRKNTVPNGSAIYTSDDVFFDLLDRRVDNEEAFIRRQECEAEHRALHNYGGGAIEFRSMDDYDELVRQIDLRRKTMTQYVNQYGGRIRTPDSNGEYALNFFQDHFRDDRLYLLDEPENSLSPKFQLQLIQLIQDCARFYNCQFVISTHSPFVMSLKGALIYDLDSIPVETKPWYELENMKLYYQLFKENQHKFE
ncbi:MAG: AAA family ATPase [Clostridia bacterium]|nr:AAA family ATPase [Clostridia bacterium]